MIRDVVRRPRCATAAVACAVVASALVPVASQAEDRDPTALYLVTLAGPGTAGAHADDAARMTTEQEALLDLVGAADPVYRWTTALNGFAVELDADQAATLSSHPDVAAVEENAVRPLAGNPRPAGAAAAVPAETSGGAGTVIGFVDTGIEPRNRAFSQVAALGPPDRDFRGGCPDAPDEEDWGTDACTDKVVGARYFVDGFGVDRLRATSSLSPLDVDGHGTQMASIAAGTAGVQVRVESQGLGRFSGVAPQARIASYKACWSAPDPRDDGCATADLVAAIDQATADGVDVLNL
ncbi:MAG TPA: S8 family serine peptidase, partial [Nocardioides sp.]|nr:S8 family serine peptidase [Nocardioides sp.]